MNKVQIYKDLCTELNKDKYGDKIDYKTIIYALEQVLGRSVKYEELSLCVYKNGSVNNATSSLIYIDANLKNVPYDIDIYFHDKYFPIVDILDSQTQTYNNNVKAFPNYIHIDEIGMYIKTKEKVVSKHAVITYLTSFIEIIKFQEAFEAKEVSENTFTEKECKDEEPKNSLLIDLNHEILNSFLFWLSMMFIVGFVAWFILLTVMSYINNRYYVDETDDDCIEEDALLETILEWIAREYKDIPFNIKIIFGNNTSVMNVYARLILDDKDINITNDRVSNVPISDEDKKVIQNAVEKYLTKQDIEGRFSMKL